MVRWTKQWLVSLVFATKLLFVSCQEYCSDNYYIPSNGLRRPSYFNEYYLDGAVLRYSCDENYELHPNSSLQTCDKGTWNPEKPPLCLKVSSEGCNKPSSIPMGSTAHWDDFYPVGANITYHCEEGTILIGEDTRTCISNGNWSGTPPTCQPASHPVYNPFCPKPPPLYDGVVLCCSGAGSPLNPNYYCCESGGEVQFECNPGFVLIGAPQWECGENGAWIGQSLPTCERVTTAVLPHADDSPLSDGMMRAVVGVSSGVLALLLIVVVLSFCKPRLRDIKRRWRDSREDENGLIVNGQRVVLPTYEEAISNREPSWCDSYNQIPAPHHLNALSSSQLPSSSGNTDVTRPPESNVTVDDLIVFPASSHNLNFTNAHRSHNPAHLIDDNNTVEDHAARAQPLPTRDDLTIFEFLNEIPCSSRDACEEVVGFEDSFVPIGDASYEPSAPSAQSPAISVSTNDSVSAPLLASAVPPKPIEGSTAVEVSGLSATGGSPVVKSDVAESAETKVTCNESQPKCRNCTSEVFLSGNDHVKALKLDQFTVPGDMESISNSNQEVDQTAEDVSFHTNSTPV